MAPVPTSTSMPFDMMVDYLNDHTVGSFHAVLLTSLYHRAVTYHDNQPVRVVEKQQPRGLTPAPVLV